MSDPAQSAAQKPGAAVGFAFLALAVFSYGGLWPVMCAGVQYLPPLCSRCWPRPGG